MYSTDKQMHIFLFFSDTLTESIAQYIKVSKVILDDPFCSHKDLAHCVIDSISSYKTSTL